MPAVTARAMTARQLAALMRRAGVRNAARLADRVGVHRSTALRWLTGVTTIGRANAALIRSVLGDGERC